MECRSCIKGTSPEIWAFSCFVSGMDPALNFNLFFFLISLREKNTKSQIYFKYLMKIRDKMSHNNLKCHRFFILF